MPRSLCIALAVLCGIGAAANGLFMLLSPERWYLTLPGVTTTGPFNQHFVRDIGLTFLLIGTSFLAGAASSRHRVILWAVPTLWLCGHALFHLWEVVAGISAHSAVARDFAAVMVPPVIGVVLTVWAYLANEREPRAADDRA